MSKPVKELITKELASRYGEQSNAVWIELVGVDGITTNAFRRELRARRMRLEVVKTSLFRRACASGPLAPLATALSGPAALITGGDSAIEIAKLLDEWTPKFPKDSFRLRGAVLEGELLDAERARGLSKMASKADLQARIVSIALSPGANLAAAVLSGGRNVAGCLKALIEKLEKGEEIRKSA
jgi:large subunit ribosomal protein L10